MLIVSAVIAAAAGLILSAGLTPLSQRLARRVGMLDAPTSRKDHAAPTPLLGGCPILLAVLAPISAALAFAAATAHDPPGWLPAELAVHLPGVSARIPMVIGIGAGAVALHILGLIDDRRGLPAWVKLLGQFIVAGGVVVFADVRVLTIAGPAVSIAATVVWLVVITNAFNFLDNMDGLSVGTAAICAAALLAAAAQMGQLFVATWLCVLLGALLGYLPFNFPPARTFMGDAGSLVIGYLLGVLSCLTTYVGPGASLSLAAMLVPLVLMAVPLYDMVSVIVLRLQDGRSVFVGDRRHFSHRLVRRGMTPRSAVLTIYLCTVGTAIGASLLPHTDNIGAALVAGQTVLILSIIALLEWGGWSAGAAADGDGPPGS